MAMRLPTRRSAVTVRPSASAERRLRGAQQEGVVDPDALQRLPQDARLQRFQIDRDVRQFRHNCIVGQALGCCGLQPALAPDARVFPSLCRRWLRGAQQERVVDPDALQRLPQDARLQRFQIDRNVRQLRHYCIVGQALGCCGLQPPWPRKRESSPASTGGGSAVRSRKGVWMRIPGRGCSRIRVQRFQVDGNVRQLRHNCIVL